MSQQTLEAVIRKTLAATEQEITYAFQGGEPTLRGLDFFRSAVALVNRYNTRGIRVYYALQTNGLRLDGEWCRFLRENNFLVGVSVDGTRSLHDACRRTCGGEPTYDRVTENLEWLRQAGVECNVLTVVTEELAGHAREIYEHYRSRGWNFQQYIPCLDPLGEPHGRWPGSLTARSYGRFLAELFDLWYEDLLRGTQPYIGRFENDIAIAAGFPAQACDRCGICSVQYVVEADGSAYPCDFYMLDEDLLGNFRTDSVAQMDEKRREIGFVERSRRIARKCRSCPFLGICRSGCQRSRVYLPREDAYVSRFCEGYEFYFSHCLGRMQRIARKVRTSR